jgi:phosphohistidine phosphatase
LLRHGKAESVSATGGDFDRRLTDRGRRDSALIGRALAEGGVRPDLALVSAAARALETWDEVSRAFPGVQAQIARGLYLAAPEQILAALDTASDELCVIVVGHNPGLHELALSLALAQGETIAGLETLPTAAAVVLEPNAAPGAPGRWRLYRPRDFGGGPS